jgi:hypothetical protein
MFISQTDIPVKTSDNTVIVIVIGRQTQGKAVYILLE